MRGRALFIRATLIASLVLTCTPLCVGRLVAQTPSLLPATPSRPPLVPASPPRPTPAPIHPDLPNAPSSAAPLEDVVSAAVAAFSTTGDQIPAITSSSRPVWQTDPADNPYQRMQQRRSRILSDQRFLNNEVSLPMSSSQKAFVAATDVADPGNLSVIALSSAIYVASNPNTPYGPGLKGFGRNYGYSISQDVTGEFFGTWLIPSLAHEDPRYHRMPGAPFGKRVLHALSHTVISQHDNGSPMPNYATLLTYPISATIANQYVPGIHRDVPSTTKRVVIGLASDPADALIGEFLPDVARRIHIRVTFFQQIINDISAEHPM